MDKPLISVLLPVYNAAKFLPETLNSLLIQSYENFEVIAINDGSTDDSLKILKKYTKQDKRIKIINQENSGIVKTLNTAAKVASGEYLARIDSDDIATPKRFELQIKELLDDPRCVLVASSFDVINEDSEFIYHAAVPTIQGDIINAMLYRNPIAHGSTMIRKKAFESAGGYSSDCGPTEDYDLWIRLLDIGTIKVLPNALFRWRVNSTGITSTQSSSMKEFMDKNIDVFWKKHDFKFLNRKKLLTRCNYYVLNYPLNGVAIKEAVLHDLCKVSLKLIKKHRFIKGISQFIVIASTGRTGFRIINTALNEVFDWYITRRFK